MTGNRTNTLLLTVIGVATLLVAVIGATFAYFTANISGGDQGTTITVGAGELKIVYQGGEMLLSDDIEPAVNEPAMIKTFTVTGSNTTESIMPYELEFVITENTFTDNALSYTLTSTSTDNNGQIVGQITETPILGGARTISLGNGNFSGVVANKEHSYELKVFFQETHVVQDENKGKTFGAYVNTKVGAISTTSTP
ncbi:MAG: hypothetical protein PHF21_02425 [Bacilli bacterium]|nr:hypothetical protein [Bacilli bacterium]